MPHFRSNSPASFYVPIVTPARLQPLGPNLPRSGNRLTRAIGRWAFALLGWRMEGALPDIPRLVLIAAPHTSNWDFIVGIAAKLGLGLRVLWLGKDSLFRPPLGALMRRLGGIPVDRSASRDVVAGIVREFEQRERFVLALAPEGTRKKVERWRTGFYHIAHGARVPIVTVGLNWGRRAIEIGRPFHTTGDVDADIAALRASFDGVSGRNARA
jgi:1-acyl-sn-glycerol-3-phosphate acyltransferase